MKILRPRNLTQEQGNMLMTVGQFAYNVRTSFIHEAWSEVEEKHLIPHLISKLNEQCTSSFVDYNAIFRFIGELDTTNRTILERYVLSTHTPLTAFSNYYDDSHMIKTLTDVKNVLKLESIENFERATPIWHSMIPDTNTHFYFIDLPTMRGKPILTDDIYKVYDLIKSRLDYLKTCKTAHKTLVHV